jgi:hypothetical protein
MLFGVTDTLTVLGEDVPPLLLVTIKLKVSVVPAVTNGAVNVRVGVLAPANATNVPPICCH